MAEALDLPQEERHTLKKLIKKLVKQGRLAYGAEHLVQPGRSSTGNLITGIFRRASRFSFRATVGHATRS